MNTSELENNIKVLRAAHNWTQDELAQRVSVTRKTINTIENRRFTPSTVLAIRIARAFCTTVEEVFHLPEE
ncbi:MAG: helix-turn-helix transcriptional regulator [Anaerolineales bacterium]|nr:helix-turn-helix transcriptional regulator [Anaerolineales bacterium]